MKPNTIQAAEDFAANIPMDKWSDMTNYERMVAYADSLHDGNQQRHDEYTAEKGKTFLNKFQLSEADQMTILHWFEYFIYSQQRPDLSGWISVEDRLPETKEDRHGNICSDNVLTIQDGQLWVMCFCLLPDDENDLAWFWCNCYGDIHGDGELDSDYKPTHWQPLPTPPQDKTK